MKVRKLVLWLLSIVLVGMVAFGTVAYVFVTAKLDTVAKVDLDRPLAVPPLARSSLDDRRRRVFDPNMQEGSTGRPRIRA